MFWCRLDNLAFLEIALAADKLLITGNRRRFPASACGPVRVQAPVDFLEYWAKHNK